jgi:Flp pilus assembly protein TadG
MKGPRRIGGDAQGSVTVTLGLTLLVLLIAGGAAIDLYRLASARRAAQQALDSGVLAAAGSRERSDAKVRRVAENFIDSNLQTRFLEDRRTTIFEQDEASGRIRMSLSAAVPTTFMSLAGFKRMPVTVTAEAERGVAQPVELALVLDNTWSMSDVDDLGVKKITALKSAAKLLVSEVMSKSDGAVAVSVVPYADYVNVGTNNRRTGWVDVPEDYSVTTEKVCTKKTTKQVNQNCRKGAPKTCTSNIDGVITTSDCTPTICDTVTVTVPEYETCSGGTTTWYRWYGCVSSRKEGIWRLNDKPGKAYPGLLATSQNCLNPILPLTTEKGKIDNAIDKLVVNIGGYKPLTYIPAGLTWGVATLSPQAPFTEGRAYDERNRDPRKILVLMTDGENTLRFVPSNGLHQGFSSNGNTAKVQKTATDKDTADLCAYAKDQGIEVFTVLLDVESDAARDLLRACGTDPAHAFNASDSAALTDAFADIARAITQVRLVK